jgi:hypothetical protein
MLEQYEKPSQVSKGGIFMAEQSAIVPFVAPAKQRQRPQQGELRKLSEQDGVQLLRFLYPLVQELHTRVDSRPLRTLVQTTEAILALRDSTHGLLLSELGSSLEGLEAGGGGTKRLGTLIRHRKWQARQIESFLWQKADDQVSKCEQLGEEGLVIWDGTVLEKPESLAPEGLCAVSSSKAVRLTHRKSGSSHRPGAAIFVPGMPGIGLVLAGRQASLGPASVIALRWCTSRGALASSEKEENCKLLRLTSRWWGRRVLHVFDRGYASGPWLAALRGFDSRFIVRWKLNEHLIDEAGVKQAAWKIPRGKVGVAPRTIWDAVHHRTVQGSVLCFPIPTRTCLIGR